MLTDRTTLGATPEGIALHSSLKEKNLTRAEKRIAWSALSEKLSQQQTATRIHAYAQKSHPESVWRKTELPTLRKNKNVRMVYIRDASDSGKNTLLSKTHKNAWEVS